MEREKRLLSVSQLNEYLKMLLDGDPILSNLFIRGEISNCKLYASGHLYFTLKDEDGQLKAVMFRSYASRLGFRPEDGMKVIVHGYVSVYPQNGQYQFYADDMQPDGAGALALRFEQLKRKLEAEGLFSVARKKPLPEMPMRIGVITSPSGAAVHDIRNVLGRRFPCAQMILFPSAVQGAEAPAQLMLGLEFFSMTQLVDVIILGRGGGSAEDLWAFNDESLARAVAACPIPVISAVGHESDFTICDFVADCRAPTPSAAAELAVPDRAELLGSLQLRQERMRSLVSTRIAQNKRMLQNVAGDVLFRHPERITQLFCQRLAEHELRLSRAMEKKHDESRNQLSGMSGRLEALSPLSVMARGYASVSKDEKNITSVSQVAAGDALRIRFSDGTARVLVQQTKGMSENAKEKHDV